MKVGDIVKQHGKNLKGLSVGKGLGVVIKIKEYPLEIPKHRKEIMSQMMGRSVTVMWETGKIHENFSENMLEVVVESD